MFYKLGKELFRLFINFLQGIRLVLVFLSFAVILFWLMQLGGATYLAPVTPFFDSIKDFTHLFYSRIVVIDGINVDFSFLVAAILMLSIMVILKFVVEYVEILEKKYDSIYKYFKKKTEELFNADLKQQYLLSEHKNNKLLILVSFDVKNLNKDSFFHKDVNVGLEEKQKEILLAFSESLEKEFDYQKKFLNDGLLMYFNNFNNSDKIIFSIEETVRNLKIKYIAERWQLEFIAGIEVYASDREVITRIKNLIMLIRLKLYGKILCLGSFKQRYLLQKRPKYTVEGNGIYTINDKEEEVFCIRKLK